MARLTGPATAATAAQPSRNQSRKPWLRTPLCNHRATMPPATCATIAQPRCNKAQPSRNHPIFNPRNRATIPLRGGEMVAPPRARIPKHPAKPPNRPAFGSSRFRRFRPGHRQRPSVRQSLTPQHSPFTPTAGQAARTCTEIARKLHSKPCAHSGGELPSSSSFPRSIDIRKAASAPCSALASHRSAASTASTSPRAAVLAHTMPTRQTVIRDQACSCCISGIRPHDARSRERGFRARSLMIFNTLGRKDACEGRAFGAAASLADRISPPLCALRTVGSPRPHRVPGETLPTWASHCAFPGLPPVFSNRGGWGGFSAVRINRPAQSLHDAAPKKSFRAVIGIPTARTTTRQDSARVTHRVARHVGLFGWPPMRGLTSGLLAGGDE
jgi:hypothetical protein